ncbi:hypothetical protein EV363DRAFT_1167694, partial [Boletus edulis]
RTHPPHPASIFHSGSSQLTSWGSERTSPTAVHTRLRVVPTLSCPTRQVGLPFRAEERFALLPINLFFSP